MTHTPDGTPIDITIRVADRPAPVPAPPLAAAGPHEPAVILEVADHGPA